MNITASNRHRHLGLGLTGFIALWGIVSIIATSFQCGSTHPWRTSNRESQCIDLVGLTPIFRRMADRNADSLLARYERHQHADRSGPDSVPCPHHCYSSDEHSEEGHYTYVLWCTIIASRPSLLLSDQDLTEPRDVVATAIQMAYIDGFSSSNPTRDLWKWTLVTQIVECITILTSCVPYLRPLLESIPSGLYGSDEIRRRGTPSEVGYSRRKGGSYQLSSTDSKTDGTSPRSRPQSGKSRHESSMKRFLPMLSQERTTHSNSASGVPGGPRRLDGRIDVEITATRNGSEKDKKWETDSIGSNSKILKTTVVSAEWEEAQRQSREASEDEIKVLR